MLVGASALSDGQARRAGAHCGAYMQFLPHGASGDHRRDHQTKIDREFLLACNRAFAAGWARGTQELCGNPCSRPVGSGDGCVSRCGVGPLCGMPGAVRPYGLPVRNTSEIAGAFWASSLDQAAGKFSLYPNPTVIVRMVLAQERFAGCSKRPSSAAAASEEARRTLRYVEPLNDARTKLADFFSILLAD